jgi:hypothetical protein
MSQILKKSSGAILLVLFYSFIFILYTTPLWANFSEGYIGENSGNSDANQYVWNAYIFKKSLLEGGNPFFTDMVLFPHGSWLFFHTYTPIIGLLHLLVPDSVTAVNLALLISFALSGVGAFYFCRHFVKNTGFALAAGLIFSFCPYKTAHLYGHYHLMLTASIPFFTLFFIKGFSFRPNKIGFSVTNWYYAFGCVVLLLVSFLSDYYTLFFLLYFSLGYGAYKVFLQNVNWGKPRTWAYIAGIFVVSNLLLKLCKSLKLENRGGFWWGGDLSSYFVTPTHLHALSQSFSEKFYGSSKFFATPNSVENIVFPGYVLLLVTLVAFVWARKITIENSLKPLVFLTVIFFMMTLPELKILGKGFFKMPTALLHYVPVLNNIRCPTRINVMFMLLLPVCCFYILNSRISFRYPKVSSLLPGLLILLAVGAEYKPKPFPMILKQDMPQAYRAVAGMEGEVLFTFPFGIRDGMHEKGKIVLNDLFYQTMHHKKMPGAYISRINETVLNNFDKDTVISSFLKLQDDAAFVPNTPDAASRQKFMETYRPDFFLISPATNQKGIEAYLYKVYPPGRLSRAEYEHYVVLKVNKNR